MSDSAFKIAHDALTTLELYSRAYASSAQFQAHKAEVAFILENASQNHQGNYGGALLAAMAKVISET